MPDDRPNILFIMSDDHAAHAMSCYGSRINRTPNLDRIADGGMRFNHCYCTNSICTPSRAAILAGTYNHVNGVTTLATPMDNSLPTFPKMLREAGYRTALFGKWHLGQGAAHCPTGFDDWAVLPGQGYYHNPTFIFKGPDGGTRRTVPGYVTDIITDMCLDWLRHSRDPDTPFCLCYHHKAPHRPWYPDEKHAHLFLNETVPEPDTLLDDYADRAAAAGAAAMRVGVDMTPTDLKCEMPDAMDEADRRRWGYQRYIKDYLRVVQSVDDNVGRILDFLDAQGLADNTLVIYTSDQGFFLGDHGWYDKRFMYEESLKMPFILRYPREVQAGSVNNDIVLNVDFPALFLDLAGVPIPGHFQGRSFWPLLQGSTPPDWRQAMYYRYWMNQTDHNVGAHYGIRTHAHKLIYYYYDGCGQRGTDGRHCGGTRPVPSLADLEPEWELFDLEKDPYELKNVVNDPAYAGVAAELKDALHRLQADVGDTRYARDAD
ncbi:MAG: sulfatase [Lentisphaerae bacterium]|nr:sulfatase [Lentisphaerota bacterium]